MPDHALLALQGPAAAAVAGAARAGAGAPHLHDRRRGADRRHRLLRHALRLHRRGRLRDLGRRRARRGAGARAARPARGEARRPRRARHAAARSGPVPLRPRHRHDDHAGRGRPHLGDPEGAPPGRRARRRLSGRGDDRAPARARRGDASASACVGLERVPVREGAAIVDDARPRLGHVTSGTIGPTVDQPVAMAYLRDRARGRGTRSMPTCAASASRCRSRRCRSRRTATTAADRRCSAVQRITTSRSRP